ncbi:cation-translocating P-type ATPase [Nocardioides sp. Soil805]|uniref:cation-translocating P-type ATPase n=1 Tax=Nocardioides sp. Soil805 TaxID=1736416 RepID=UPI000B2E48B4|nr:cation-translocating P-type ATPase [Nocardioides sp. Soil805]
MEDTGLTVAEAALRLREVGPNEVRQRGRLSVWSSIGAQLRDPLVVVLLAACLMTLLTGDLTDAAVIAFVVVVNTAVGVTQEIRADRAISALAQLSAPVVRVRRGGAETPVPAVELVPGDVVLLGEGDVVPADCELLEAASVLVDESALTGESVAVGKGVPHGEAVGDVLSSGTVVVKGRAVARVTETGASSSWGRIVALMDTRVQPTPLQLRLAELGRTLALVAVALCALVLVLGLARGEPLEPMLVTAVSLAVAAVPESLPAVVTFSLALGARRMVARNAVVRRLPAVETLGSVTVLATDKTGTLTEARMVVEELWTPERSVSVTGGAALELERVPDVRELLRACVLCNDAHLAPVGTHGPGAGLGDPTELALLRVAARAGLSRKALERVAARIGEVPFDSATQRMTTAHEVVVGGDPRLLVVTKGSVEALHAQHGSSGQSAAWRAGLARATELAGEGHRVLAFTAADVPNGADWEAAEHRLLGLVAMDDPAKPAARSTITHCRTAGIVPVLVTGDHPATARAVALRVGVLTPDEDAAGTSVVTGAQIAAGEVLDLTVPRVFARTSPEQKLDIVQAWKDRGAVVAMTGDGVNDGPALHRADIGVAMGHRGTEVARQAADLVLADDDLATVVVAVQEGRRVYANIRHFLVFGLSGGAAEILVMLLGPFVGLAVPLTAAQILWINLLTHGITGVAIGAEPVAPDVMTRPPRPPAQSVLGDGLWQRVLVISAFLSVVTLALGTWAHHEGRPWQTMIFLALTCLQLGVAVGLRPLQLTTQNPFLPVAVAGSFLLALAGVYVPVLQELLGTSSLPAADLALAVGTGLLGWLAARLTHTSAPTTAGAPPTPGGPGRRRSAGRR